MTPAFVSDLCWWPHFSSQGECWREFTLWFCDDEEDDDDDEDDVDDVDDDIRWYRNPLDL